MPPFQPVHSFEKSFWAALLYAYTILHGHGPTDDGRVTHVMLAQGRDRVRSDGWGPDVAVDGALVEERQDR
jgi:hypothetical protein